MAIEVIMPKMGETMEQGTILEWLVAQGEPVEKGQPLVEIETDKAVFEVESPGSGILRKILYGKDATVPVLTVIAIIADAGEDISAYEVRVEEEVRPPIAPAREVKLEERAAERILASPRARKLAQEEGVDLSKVVGSGPKGRIVEEDVRAYLEAKVVAPAVVAPPPVEVVPVAGVRAIIARRMHESHATTAPVTLTTEADATALVEVREQLKAALADELGFNLGYNELLVKVAAQALREFPYINARLKGEEIHYLEAINVGVAVDSERGLLVPVIRAADRKGLTTIAQELRLLVERARAGKSLPDDLTGGTFTITNLGVHEVDGFTPLINLPECAVLGVGRIRPRPAVVEGKICIRQMMWLSLTFDHRLVDGAPAARFLQRVKELIEKPYLLLTMGALG